MIDVIDKFLGKSDRRFLTLIDARYRNGQFAQVLLSLGIRYVVELDFSRKMILDSKERAKICNYRNHMKLVVSGLEILNFKDKSFDGVFMFGMIEHLGSPKEILKKISKSLKCGWKLILDVPRKGSILYYSFLIFSGSPKWWGIQVKLYHLLDVDKTKYYKFFTEIELLQIISAVDLLIIMNRIPIEFFQCRNLGSFRLEKILIKKIIQNMLDRIAKFFFRIPAGELKLA